MANVRPVSAPSAPAVCLPSFFFFINHLPAFKNFTILPCMSVIRSNKSNRTVSVHIIRPRNKLILPVTRLFDLFKSFSGIMNTKVNWWYPLQKLKKIVRGKLFPGSAISQHLPILSRISQKSQPWPNVRPIT